MAYKRMCGNRSKKSKVRNKCIKNRTKQVDSNSMRKEAENE